jgi:hypothetical protein
MTQRTRFANNNMASIPMPMSMRMEQTWRAWSAKVASC